MSHTTVSSALPAQVYNRLLIDHEATEQAKLLKLKSKHVPALAKIIELHGVSNYVELHLLHRHFNLQEGEAMVHKPFVTPQSGGKSITIDIAKAVPCPLYACSSLFPLMWMSSLTEGLVAYEYGTHGIGSQQPRRLWDLTANTWNAFAKDFCAYVETAGIKNVVSLKDKSCDTGGEYVAPDIRALFRIPFSSINRQPASGLIETGWTVEHNTSLEVDGLPEPMPEPTDGHVTQTKHTTGGTVATHHKTTEDGVDAIDAKEVDPVYTAGMWKEVKSQGFLNLCPIVG